MISVDSIRPKDLEAQCDRLMDEDRRRIDKNTLLEVGCVACGSIKMIDSFLKQGFEYRRCSNCNTLYLSPRMSQSTLNDFSLPQRLWSIGERFCFH